MRQARPYRAAFEGGESRAPLWLWRSPRRGRSLAVPVFALRCELRDPQRWKGEVTQRLHYPIYWRFLPLIQPGPSFGEKRDALGSELKS